VEPRGPPVLRCLIHYQVPPSGQFLGFEVPQWRSLGHVLCAGRYGRSYEDGIDALEDSQWIRWCPICHGEKRLSLRAPCVHRGQLHGPGVYPDQGIWPRMPLSVTERDRILDWALASRMAGGHSGHDYPISERVILRRTGPVITKPGQPISWDG
jgi:hypothetical protein